MKFLIDECLCTDLVSVARVAGYEAHHVAHVGKAGWKDWNVARLARNDDFVLVTNNASDFRKIYAKQALHAGLVILIPNVGRGIQCQLFRCVIDRLVRLGEPINRVVEIDLDGKEVIFTLYDLPVNP